MLFKGRLNIEQFLKTGLLSWAFFISFFIQGQIKETIDLNVQHYSVKQGLPNNKVNFTF